MYMFRLLWFFVFTAFFLSCGSDIKHDLIILNATLLDVENGKQIEHQNLAISNGIIQTISSKKSNLKASKTIDAGGKLITPGLIDVHIHPISKFADGEYDLVPDTFPRDSLSYYRALLTEDYINEGVTTVLMMGHPDSWTNDFLEWSMHPDSNHIDVYTCGGALATEDGHTYPGHLRVLDPKKAKEKIIEYHKKGIKHLKLYWRLRAPEFQAIQQTADSLGMKMFAHSGGFFDPTQMTIGEAMELGVRSFEHIAILPCSVFENEDWAIIHQEYQSNFSGLEGAPDQLSLIYILETFKYAEENKKQELIQLIDTMAMKGCDISTTIGWVYKTYHETFFGPAKIMNLSPEQFKRCDDNFAILMEYVNHIHSKNIPIRIASDTSPGGKIVLLEMLLLIEYGMDPEEVFKIATINGAKAMGIENKTGSLTPEKKANLIIWENNPIHDPNHLTGQKMILKDGKSINN